MNDLLKQDVFFFVTTIAVIIFAILLCVLLFYLIGISRKINYITGKAKEQTDLFSNELGELHKNIRSTGFKFRHVLSFFSNISKKKK